MILVDTSIWIELFAGRATASREDLLLFATCGPVIQEVLQGLRPGRRAERIRWQLLGLPRLSDPVGVELYLQAADLYATLRRRGITIRSSVDCLIAAIAINSKVPIWHVDRDFDRIAEVSSLEIWRLLEQ